MKLYCEYCGSPLKDTDERCENCGAINSHHKRAANDTPKTIQELKDWYVARNLPDENITRFFIGKNIKEPKAFGIYEERPGYFVVYKNKASGERAIRYEGTDEAYAVNELYLKLKSEILNQKSRNLSSNKNQKPKSRVKSAFQIIGFNLLAIISIIGLLLLIGLLEYKFNLVSKSGSMMLFTCLFFIPVVVIGVLLNTFVLHKRIKPVIHIGKKKLNLVGVWLLISLCCGIYIGNKYETPTYYRYDNITYCEYRHDFYEYNGADYYKIDDYDLPYELQENLDDYVWDHSDSSWFTEFEDSDTYSDIHYSDSDSDSGYDWDSGSSWDSGGTNWDSDW